MTILGYETGPIACEAAFAADFDMEGGIPLAAMISAIDSDRRSMDVRPGMRSKYVPLRFDPITGARQIGGRYLFETWANAVDFARFTTEELEFEPGVKFWERPFFANIDKRAWRVIGAHDFAPIATHYANRFERFAYDAPTPTRGLEAAWPDLRDAAGADGLAATWLLLQPEERQVGMLTVAAKLPGEDEAGRAAATLAALERRPSLSRHLPQSLGLRPLFDRTSLNLALWLPRSRSLGGDPTGFPTYPLHPLPEPAA